MAVVISCDNNVVDRVFSGFSRNGIFDEITGTKWSRNPYRLSDRSHLSIELLPGVDYYEYYAFNRDSTVDNWCGDWCWTGSFSIEGDLVTCMFVKVFSEIDSTIADDGDYNYKVVLRYKRGKLYLHDALTRNQECVWVSDFDMDNRTLFFKNVGRYVSDRDLGYYPFDAYDSTVDNRSVYDRYDCRCEAYFKNGKRNGSYHKITDGRLIVFGTYTDGMPTGKWYFYGRDASLEYVVSNIRSAPSNTHNRKYIGDAVSFIWDDDGSNTRTVYFGDEDLPLCPSFRYYRLFVE